MTSCQHETMGSDFSLLFVPVANDSQSESGREIDAFVMAVSSVIWLNFIPFALLAFDIEEVGQNMAINESSREDLIREATALTERAELQLSDDSPVITIGFRRNGAFSLFIDQDPVYQFDTQFRLRRAFVEGLLYRSQQTTLAQMLRERTATQTILNRTDLPAAQLAEFRQKMIHDLTGILTAVEAGQVAILRQVPEDFDVAWRVTATLRAILEPREDWLAAAISPR